ASARERLYSVRGGVGAAPVVGGGFAQHGEHCRCQVFHSPPPFVWPGIRQGSIRLLVSSTAALHVGCHARNSTELDAVVIDLTIVSSATANAHMPTLWNRMSVSPASPRSTSPYVASVRAMSAITWLPNGSGTATHSGVVPTTGSPPDGCGARGGDVAVMMLANPRSHRSLAHTRRAPDGEKF